MWNCSIDKFSQDPLGFYLILDKGMFKSSANQIYSARVAQSVERVALIYETSKPQGRGFEPHLGLFAILFGFGSAT